MLSTTLLLLVASCGLVSLAQETLPTCEETRAAFTAQTSHPVTVTPTVPISGQFHQLCSETIDTCCNSFMESALENHTLEALSQPLPPNFITPMLDSIADTVNSNYDSVDTVVSNAVITIGSNASGISTVFASQLVELMDAMRLLHGDGTAVDILGILNRFFAHQILLLVKDEIPSAPVSEELTSCAAERIIQEPLASTLADISAKLTQQLRAVFDIRNTVIDLYFLAINLDLEGAPFAECVRAYAELHYCHICVPLPGYPAARPCRNVCQNVMLGCSSFLHQYREAVTAKAREALDMLEVVQMEENGFLQTIERVGAELQKLEGSIQGKAASIVSQVSSCPTMTRRRRRHLTPQRNTRQLIGAVDSSSPALPVALSQDLYDKVYVELEASHFVRFDGLSVSIADDICNGLPTSNCWNQENVGADSTAVVSPGSEAISSNPDLQPKGDIDIRNKTNILTEFFPLVADASVTQYCTTGGLVAALVTVCVAIML